MCIWFTVWWQVLDRHTAQDVLRAVLHSILFHRLFGTVNPRLFEVLDVTLPGVSNLEMEQMVDEKVNIFWRAVETIPSASAGAGRSREKKGQIEVTFSEKKPKKSWFNVYMGEEDVPWEQWCVDFFLIASVRLTPLIRIITATISQPKPQDREAFNSAITHALTKSLFTMLTHTSSERGRTAVPLITNKDGISPFPINVKVKVGGVEVG